MKSFLVMPAMAFGFLVAVNTGIVSIGPTVKLNQKELRLVYGADVVDGEEDETGTILPDCTVNKKTTPDCTGSNCPSGLKYDVWVAAAPDENNRRRPNGTKSMCTPAGCTTQIVDTTDDKCRWKKSPAVGGGGGGTVIIEDLP